MSTTTPTTTAPAWQAWAPPLDPPVDTGLPVATAQQIADANADASPYLIAALMWESYAAQLPVTPVATSVSTGSQSVSYSGGGDAFSLAIARANWLRSMLGDLGSMPLSTDTATPWPFDWWQRNLEHPW